MLLLPEFLMFPLGGNEEMWLSMKEGEKSFMMAKKKVLGKYMEEKKEAEREYAKMKNETKYEQKMEHVLADAVFTQIKNFSYTGAFTIDKENTGKMKTLLFDNGYRILNIETASENKHRDRIIYTCAPYFIMKPSNSPFMAAKKVAMRVKDRIDKEVSLILETDVYPNRRLAEDAKKNFITMDFATPSVDFKDEVIRRLYREGYDVNVIMESMYSVRVRIGWNPNSRIENENRSSEASNTLDVDRKNELKDLFREAVESKILECEYESSILKDELMNEMEYKYIEELATNGGFYLPDGCDEDRSHGIWINISWHPYLLTKTGKDIDGIVDPGIARFNARNCAERTKKKIDMTVGQAILRLDNAISRDGVSSVAFPAEAFRNGNIMDALREKLTKRNMAHRTIDGGIVVYNKKE